MSPETKMAFWATVNALLHARKQTALDFGEIRTWWDRFEHEIEMERAYRAGRIGD